MKFNEILAAFKIVVMITIVSTITVLLAILCLPKTSSTSSSDSIIEINTLYDIYYIDVNNNQVTFESNSDTLQFSNISSISSYIKNITGEDARRCAGLTN